MPSSARVRLRHVVLLATVATVLAACGGSASGASDDDGFTLRVGLTAVNGTIQGNLGWGDEEGLLLDELRSVGVEDIEFSLFQSGTDVTSALLSGAVDVAVTGDNPALTARARGADTRLIGLSTISGETLLIGRPDGPTRLEDLVGKTVAAPEGTIRDRVAKGLLDAVGLSDEVPVRNVPTPEAIAGLSSGSIDATPVTGTTAIELVEKGFVVIARASDHDLESTEPNTVLQSFLDEHPDFAAAWAGALESVNEHLRDNGEAYWEYSATKDGVDVDIARETEPLDIFPLEALSEEGLAQLAGTYEYLLAAGTLETPFRIEDWVVRP